jgi:two-component system, LytTR family, sensor kinase
LEDLTQRQNYNQLWILLISGLVSLLVLLSSHLFFSHLYSAISLISMAFNVICSYFFYQLFDLIGNKAGIQFRWRGLKFFYEFTKLISAIFCAASIQFYYISKPLLRQNYDPNHLLVILAIAFPAAAIARIIFELRQAKELAIQSKLAQAEAQYNLLETQMQPHFLFNSLNVLSELIYVDPDLACSVTQQLADLYREILTNSKQKFSNLGSEISILKKYIQIQKIRFGERIRFKCDVGAEFFNISVPSLILQTLVENAIKHGISPRQEGGDIELTVTPDPDSLFNKTGPMYNICVSNTGELFKGVKKKDNGGTGLQNTKNRLDLFYGHSHGFRIHSDDKKTYVQFKVPALQKEPDFT